MTDEEIMKVAMKVIELQEAQSKSKVISVNKTSEVQSKYHKKLWDIFGSTGTIEAAVRTVATYMAGGRTLSTLSLEQHYKCLEIMDELFGRICADREEI